MVFGDAFINNKNTFCDSLLLTDMIYNQFIRAFTFAALNTVVGFCSTGSDVFYL